MDGKSFFIDMSKCTACRGCQVACKQWHKFGAEQTKNTGSHQNPPDLTPITYKLVRFTEVVDKNGDLVKWLFFPEQCRHCVNPPCKAVGDGFDEEAIIHDTETGAVVFTEKTKAIEGMEPGELCPYNIPRQDKETGVWSKCDMCHDRVAQGLKPACVLSCPTGTMNFGERSDMLVLAEARLKEVQKTNPKAVLVNKDDVRVIFLAEMEPDAYYKFLSADAGAPIGPMSRRSLFANLLRPLNLG